MAVSKRAVGFMAGLVGVGPLLSGCATSNLVPSFHASSGIDHADTCQSYASVDWNPGILFFLPSFGFSAMAKENENCRVRQLAESMMGKQDIRFRTLGMAAYQVLKPENQKRVQDHLKAMGTSLEEVERDTPRVLSKTVDQEGLTVMYRLPGQADTAPAGMFFVARSEVGAYLKAHPEFAANKPPHP